MKYPHGIKQNMRYLTRLEFCLGKHQRSMSKQATYFYSLLRMSRIALLAWRGITDLLIILSIDITSVTTVKLSPSDFCKNVHLKQ